MSEKLYNRVLKSIEERRQRILDGKLNSIPIGFPRLEEDLPGIEQRQFYLVTSNSKVGKTQLADFMFLYQPFFYAFNHKEQIRLKIFYFTLEMSEEEKYFQFICHLIFILSRGTIRITPKELGSTNAKKPLDARILELIGTDEYKEYFEFFEKCVVFIDSIKNPYGIYQVMKKYALANGVMHKKMMKFIDKTTKEETEIEVDDYYVANDPDEYVEIIIDHLSLLTPEKGGSVKASIDKLSSEYLIKLRNNYKYIPVAIHQQAAAQESIDNFKANKLRPTLEGLAESKLPGRDK